jgi:putative spermidine/putrescine transport system ATP-binding protein
VDGRGQPEAPISDQTSVTHPAGEAGSRPALRLVQLTKRYGDVVAVDGVSLEVREGEFITLLGPSGSGKTTILMMVAGLIPATDGEIWLGSHLATFVPPHERDIGVVFQNYALFPHMTVADNIAFPLKMRKLGRTETRERVARALEMVQLPNVGHRYPRQLSGGQQQRIALARALVFNPSIVLMDEPLGALDKKLRQHMQLEIKHLHEQLGITAIYVTHDQEEALTMSDRVALMHEGRIAQLGPSIELYERPASEFVADFIGESNILAGRAVERTRLELADGLSATVPDEAVLRPGQPVRLVLRPEKIHLAEDGDHFDNLWEGVIDEVIYVGDTTKYRARVGQDTVLTVRRQNVRREAGLPIGRSVRLGWYAADSVVLPRKGNGGHA